MPAYPWILLGASWLPPHDRDGRNTVEGGAFDHPGTIRQIYQRPARQIDHAYDPRLLEDERGLDAKDLHLFRQLREIHGDRADLATRDGKAGAILGHADCPFHPTGARLGEMTRHPRHLRIIEGADTDFIVGTQNAKCRRHTADVLRVQPPDGAAEEHHAEHPDPPGPSHLLPSLTLADDALAASRYLTPL